jgi:hypothetical protein
MNLRLAANATSKHDSKYSIYLLLPLQLFYEYFVFVYDGNIRLVVLYGSASVLSAASGNLSLYGDDVKRGGLSKKYFQIFRNRSALGCSYSQTSETIFKLYN